MSDLHFYGAAVPKPPTWAPPNGSRGHRKAANSPTPRVVFLHTYEGGELRPVIDFLNAVATPALPPARCAQSGVNGVWYWETPDGKWTADPKQAKPSTVSGTIIRSGQTPLTLRVGDPMPWCYGPGYFSFADGATGDFFATCDPDIYSLNAQGGLANEWGLSLCFPGRASRTRTEWLSDWGRNQIKAAARYIVWAHHQYGIPLRRLHDADMYAVYNPNTKVLGPVTAGGYCGHGEASRAWGWSTHTDPGVNFPWDVLEQAIATEMENPDMNTLVKVDDNTDLALFALAGDGATWQARWIKDWAELATLQSLGMVSSTLKQVPRTALKSWRLLGPAPADVFPQYSTTHGDQFGSWDPKA